MNTEQTTLFDEEAKLIKPTPKTTRLRMLIRELGKELEKTKPLTTKELVDKAVEEGIRILNSYPNVSNDTKLWVLGKMMQEELKKLQ